MASYATPRKPRLHRLPVRTDYILIPAPLDLSLPDIAQKSPLPPIIVTPAEPSSTRDFSLAFLPAPPKPSFRERIQKSFSSVTSPSVEEPKLFPISLTTAPSTGLGGFTFRARSILALLLVLLLATCHLITHRMAMRINRPYSPVEVEFAVQNPAVAVHAQTGPGAVAHNGLLGGDAYAPTFVQGHDLPKGLGLGLGARGASPLALNWSQFRSKMAGGTSDSSIDNGSETEGVSP